MALTKVLPTDLGLVTGTGAGQSAGIVWQSSNNVHPGSGGALTINNTLLNTGGVGSIVLIEY